MIGQWISGRQDELMAWDMEKYKGRGGNTKGEKVLLLPRSGDGALASIEFSFAVLQYEYTLLKINKEVNFQKTERFTIVCPQTANS